MAHIVPQDQLADYIGKDTGASDWFLVDQKTINTFADATQDHQFIHVDEEKAKQTPFGSTIAHGFLSLSLLPHLQPSGSIAPEGTVMALNYGLNKLRFLQPVKAGSEVRAHGKIVDIIEKNPNQFLITTDMSVEIKGEEKPALIAQTLTLYIVQ
ncbi:MAG: MaoC family dehydratase [Sphingomonadales bacterium]|nr:MaoC family dehydratase [Sphingomonadales bacterium]